MAHKLLFLDILPNRLPNTELQCVMELQHIMKLQPAAKITSV